MGVRNGGGPAKEELSLRGDCHGTFSASQQAQAISNKGRPETGDGGRARADRRPGRGKTTIIKTTVILKASSLRVKQKFGKYDLPYGPSGLS